MSGISSPSIESRTMRDVLTTGGLARPRRRHKPVRIPQHAHLPTSPRALVPGTTTQCKNDGIRIYRWAVLDVQHDSGEGGRRMSRRSTLLLVGLAVLVGGPRLVPARSPRPKVVRLTVGP